jgi:hypothetical protein
MTTNTLLTQILRFGFYIGLQILLFRYLVLFNVSFCFIYIGALLALPKETSHSYLILIGFITGLIVDAFYNTMGMHAAACTIIGYLRPYLLILITPQRGYDEKSDFLIKSMGFIWFITYAGVLVLIHHFFIFFLELGSFSLFFTTLLKVFCSFIFTMFMIIIFQYFRKK